VLQGEHAAIGTPFFRASLICNLPPCTRAKFLNQDRELWEQLVASSGSQQKPVEFVISRSECLLHRKVVLFCPLDLSSKRILM